ncbi:hypothetical protein HYH03_012763 [Edaphochlamys debaryana]|uniref:phytol kinase n=1 Tax=Edaphochlamys debaryana TaxID=47281 RepID=A0A835XXN7_9CHLO|nr:hypothetical protein HYH03_012763 [Edaphochlamys debaryana]|eukprot:KAG2488765.1 hypothetical protein HYH03_012763 [Edaphochlamys debaryana]
MAAAQLHLVEDGEAAAKAVLRGATRIVLACTTSGSAAQPTAGELLGLSQQLRDCPGPDLFRLLDRPASSCQFVALLACCLRAADTTSADVSSSHLELAHALLDRLLEWRTLEAEYFISAKPTAAAEQLAWVQSLQQSLHQRPLVSLAILRSGSLQACGRLLARAEAQGVDVAAVTRVANSLVTFHDASACIIYDDDPSGFGEELAAALGASGLLHHTAYLLHKLCPAAAASEAPANGALAVAMQALTGLIASLYSVLDMPSFSAQSRAAMHSPWMSYAATAGALMALAPLDGGLTYGLPAEAVPGARELTGRASYILRDWPLVLLGCGGGDGMPSRNGAGGGGGGSGSGGGDGGPSSGSSAGDSGSSQAAAGLCFVPDAALFRIGLRVAAAASAALVEGAGEVATPAADVETAGVRLGTNALVPAATGAACTADGALSRLLAAAGGGGAPEAAAADRKLAAWWGAAVAAAGAVASTAYEWTRGPPWGAEIGTAPELAGRLAACMVQRLSPSTEEQGALSPSPPPGLAVALSAGALPALERLLRRTNGALLLADPRAGLGPSDPPAAALLSWPRLGAVLAYGDVRQAASLVATVGKLLAARVAQCDRTAGARDEQVDALVRLSLEAAVAGRAWAAERCRATDAAEAAGSSSPRPAPSSPPSAADAQLLRLVAWMHARWLPAWAAWGSGVARRLAAAPKEAREVLVRDTTAVLEALSCPLDCLPFSLTAGAHTIPQLAGATGAAAAAPAASDLTGDPYEVVALHRNRASELQRIAKAALDSASADGNSAVEAVDASQARTGTRLIGSVAIAASNLNFALASSNALRSATKAFAAAEAADVYCSAAFKVASRGRPSAEEAAAEARSVAAWGQVLLGGTAPVMTFLSDVAAVAKSQSIDVMGDGLVGLMRHRLRQLLVHLTEPTCSYLSSPADGERGAPGNSRTPRRLQPFLDAFRSRGPQPDSELEDLLLELRRGPVGAARPSGSVELPPIRAPTLRGLPLVPSLLWPPPLQLCGNGRCGCLEGDSEAVCEAAQSPCSRGCDVAWFCCAECERAALGEGHGGVCGGGGAGRSDG